MGQTDAIFTHAMLRAIGFVICLYAITQMLSEPFDAFQDAATATFNTFEVAAVVSKRQIERMAP